MSPLPPAARIARPFPVCAFLFVALAGCASTAGEPLSEDGVLGVLSRRAEGPPAELDPRVLAGLDALALERPTPEERADPRTAGHWRACALAWNPAVRAARFELVSALAAARIAGRPGSVEGMGEVVDLADASTEVKVGVTFDLLALVGIGPSGAAREGARAAARRAQAAFESAVWGAVFEVERTRVRLGASRERLARLEVLLGIVEGEGGRFEVLARRGRLSEADQVMLRAMSHEIEHVLSTQRAVAAEARAALARESGLPFAHPALDAVGPEVLDEAQPLLAESAHDDSAVELWRSDPALRQLTFEFAVAESAVRSAAAGAWPGLRAGPQLLFMPSEILVGGLLNVELPWPGNVEREVRMRAAEREGARARLEDALLAAEARVASLRIAAAEARLRAVEHAVEADRAAEANWIAAEARLSRGMLDPAAWILAAKARVQAQLGLSDERAAARIAELDLQQARGVLHAGSPAAAAPLNDGGTAPRAAREELP